MKASRLRLDESKTEIMWLGSSPQLDNIAIRNVPLISTVVTTVDPARKTAVIIHSQLSQTYIVLSAACGYDNLVQQRRHCLLTLLRH